MTTTPRPYFHTHLPIPKDNHLRPWNDDYSGTGISYDDGGDSFDFYEEYSGTDSDDYENDVDYLQAPGTDFGAAAKRSTICICCDESYRTPFHRNNHHYNRRSMLVSAEDAEAEMARLLVERAEIESEVDCRRQEPIEIVLIFESATAENSEEDGDEYDDAAAIRRRHFSHSQSRPTTTQVIHNHVNSVPVST